MRYRTMILLGVGGAMLATIGAGMVGELRHPRADKPAAEKTALPAPLAPMRFKVIGGNFNDIYSLTFDRRASHEAVERAIRAHCAGKDWCKVIGWDNPDLAATKLPMTDRQADGERVGYTFNRATGMDEASWSN